MHACVYFAVWVCVFSSACLSWFVFVAEVIGILYYDAYCFQNYLKQYICFWSESKPEKTRENLMLLKFFWRALLSHSLAFLFVGLFFVRLRIFHFFPFKFYIENKSKFLTEVFQ